MNVEERRAHLRSQVTEPGLTADMTRAERDAEMERWLAASAALDRRLIEENLVLGLGWSASVYLAHELTSPWDIATADRWFRALPERYMTPDDMIRPDWDHSHYQHDEHGRIGKVTTLQRPETQEDIDARRLVDEILADLAKEQES
jgi:hypothetical protein